MKKTFIALLLVLAIVSVNVFADDATIVVKASTEGKTLFGVSAAALTPTDYASESAFTNAISNSITSGNHDLLDFINDVSVGYLSGFNTTTSEVYLSISAGDGLINDDNDSIKIALTVSPDENQKIEAANTTPGTLHSVQIKVKGSSSNDVESAPAGSYTGTITFAVTTP